MKIAKLSLLALLATASVASAATPYLGVNVGYLFDGEDPMYSTRFGAEFASAGKLTHSVELELGMTRDSEYDITIDIVPVMANYRLGVSLFPKVSLDLGAGVGLAWNKLKYYGSSTDTAFAYQAMTGLNFSVTEKTALYAGVRYLKIGDATLHGITAEVGDDVSAEIGVKFKF